MGYAIMKDDCKKALSRCTARVGFGISCVALADGCFFSCVFFVGGANMPNRQVVELRNRIIGVLIRGARERARMTQEECAGVLGCTAAQLAACEAGEIPLSLPEMELLGRYLGVPLHALRTEHAAVENTQVQLPRPEFFLPLRQRIIGIRLRQARLESGRSLEDLAALLEQPVETLGAYERGETSIPLAELELAARALGLSLDVFVDRDSHVGRWHLLQSDFERFAELPDPVRQFVGRPINLSYLELAMKLAQMPAGSLRQIAEALLEITY